MVAQLRAADTGGRLTLLHGHRVTALDVQGGQTHGAVAVDEPEIGLAAVGAPIRNAHGDVIASMSVSGPTFRLKDEEIDRAIELVIDAAAEVSLRLGWGDR